MVLEFPKGTIFADQKPILEDLRVNIAPNHQLRIKFNRVDADGNSVPVDIVVYDYKPQIGSITSIAIKCEGREVRSNKSFNLTFSFDFLKRKWRLKGILNDNVADETFNHFIEIVSVVKALV